MNPFIEAQCRNMTAMVKTFQKSCEMAAIKDDGTISPQEAKVLKKIKAAAENFMKELEKVT